MRRAALVVALALAGCSSVPREDAAVPAPDAAVPVAGEQVIESGLASWYGLPFHGRRTASGERFDMNQLTAAHPWLPFGTRVLVRNPGNGRSVVVRINDRGPFKRGRIIDLSHAAARAIGLLSAGVQSVVLVAVPPGQGQDGN